METAQTTVTKLRHHQATTYSNLHVVPWDFVWLGRSRLGHIGLLCDPGSCQTSIHSIGGIDEQ